MQVSFYFLISVLTFSHSTISAEKMIDEMKFECDLFILESGRGGAMGEAAPHRGMEQAHDMVSLDVGLVAEEGAKS